MKSKNLISINIRRCITLFDIRIGALRANYSKSSVVVGSEASDLFHFRVYKRTDVNLAGRFGETPLQTAVRSETSSTISANTMILYLVTYKADIDRRDCYGYFACR